MARILITDDERNVRNILSKILSAMGHEVAAAFNGSEALRLFAQSPFDLVTTGFNMRVMDGNILAKRIKQKSPHTPVIMITGNALEVESRTTTHEYVDLVLSKPFTIESLEKATASLLDSDSSKQKNKASHGMEENG